MIGAELDAEAGRRLAGRQQAKIELLLELDAHPLALAPADLRAEMAASRQIELDA